MKSPNPSDLKEVQSPSGGKVKFILVLLSGLSLAGLLVLALYKKTGSAQHNASDAVTGQVVLDNFSPEFVSAPYPESYTEETLRTALAQKLNADELQLAVNPLASSPEMERWALLLTAEATNELQKAVAIYNRLVGRPGEEPAPFVKPPTAKEVFSAWNKPEWNFVCQDMTFLYVSLVRAVGVDAYCADVERDFQGTNVLHSCAVVFISGKPALVDLAYHTFGARHQKFTILNDRQVVATYLAGAKQPELAGKLAPELPYVCSSLVVTYAEHGLWHEAEDQLAKLTRHAPKGLATFSAQGTIAFYKGDFAEAIKHFQRAAAVSAETDSVQVRLGVAYMNIKNWAKARKAFEVALRCSPYETNAVCAKSMIAIVDGEEALARGGLDRAIACFSEAVDLTPGEVNSYVARARAYSMKPDWRRAVADYDIVIQLKPDYPKAYAGRGAGRLALGDLTGAKSDLEKAIKLDASMYESWFNRGLLRTKSGELNAARVDFEKALALNTNIATEIAPQFAKLGSLLNDAYELEDALRSFHDAQMAGLQSESASYVGFAIWIIRSRLGERQSASNELQALLDSQSSKSRGEWPSLIGNFLLGRVSEEMLIQSPRHENEERQNQRRCEAFYYAGIKRLIDGDKPIAKSYFEKCVATGIKNFTEYSSAVAELRRLQSD